MSILDSFVSYFQHIEVSIEAAKSKILTKSTPKTYEIMLIFDMIFNILNVRSIDINLFDVISILRSIYVSRVARKLKRKIEDK